MGMKGGLVGIAVLSVGVETDDVVTSVELGVTMTDEGVKLAVSVFEVISDKVLE